MTSTFSVTGRFTNSWPRARGLICWRMARSHGQAYRAPFRVRDHLRSGLQSPCHPCPRGHRHRARPSFGRGIGMWSSCVIRPLPHGLVWIVKRLSCGSIAVGLALPILARRPDAKLRCTSGASERFAGESPVAVSLCSLTSR